MIIAGSVGLARPSSRARFAMSATTSTALPGASVRRPPPAAPVTARRLRRPSWRDPRLLVGLLLVLASTVGGALALEAADDSVPVYVAREALVPGHVLGADDLLVAHVRISSGSHRYLSARARPPALVVLRGVPAGELVPVSAVGDARDVDLRPVAVPADGPAGGELTSGSLVDVWVAARSSSRADGFERPRQVAAGVQVSARATTTSRWGAAEASSVQLLLTPDLVPVVIEAVDNEARITLVPVPASLPDGGDGS
jgi:hypothetical protein